MSVYLFNNHGGMDNIDIEIVEIDEEIEISEEERGVVRRKKMKDKWKFVLMYIIIIAVSIGFVILYDNFLKPEYEADDITFVQNLGYSSRCIVIEDDVKNAVDLTKINMTRNRNTVKFDGENADKLMCTKIEYVHYTKEELYKLFSHDYANQKLASGDDGYWEYTVGLRKD